MSMNGEDNLDFEFTDDWGETDTNDTMTTRNGTRTSIPTEDELGINNERQDRLEAQKELARKKRMAELEEEKQKELARKKRMAELSRRQAIEQSQRQQNPNVQGQRLDTNQDERRTQQRAGNQSENLRQTVSKASSKVNSVTERATEFTRDYSEKLKSEYKADMSTDMKAKGTFGWSLYLYAVFAFGFFMFENSTALLLLAGWVILTEKNTQVNKMIISTIILYIAMKIGWSIFSSGYSLVYDLIPNKLFQLNISALKDTIYSIKKFINNLYNFAYILVGLRGLLLAKKGSYYKLKFVEDLFD